MHFRQWKRREFIMLLGGAGGYVATRCAGATDGKLPTIGLIH
jgi:hypothetical protein